MKKSTVKKYILPTAFMVFISILGAVTLFVPKNDYSEDEKRYLNKLPRFTVKSFLSGEFQDKLEKGLADRVGFRGFFVSTDAYASMAMGRNTLGDVYNCKDNYLIYSPKKQDGSVFRKNMSRFNNFSASLDVPSTIMIVPTAGYVMSDKLPLLCGKYRDAELFSTASDLTPNIGFIDTRSALRQNAADGMQVYYRTDHHLTSAGNYVLYDLFCSVNGIVHPGINSYNKEKIDGFYGTAWSASGYRLTPPDSVELWELPDRVRVTIDDAGKKKIVSDNLFFKNDSRGKDKYPVFLGGNHSLVHIENKDAKGGSILVIKDSYAQCFSCFLAHNYKNVYMIDMRYYRASVSNFVKENNIDEILYMYGIDSLLTDTNSAWLM